MEDQGCLQETTTINSLSLSPLATATSDPVIAMIVVIIIIDLHAISINITISANHWNTFSFRQMAQLIL